MSANDFRAYEIPEKPALPPRLKRAVLDEKIIVFYGAGVSRIIGCDGWRQMADRLVEVAFEKGAVSFWEKEKIKKDYEPRKAISIIRRLLPLEDYQSTLKRSLEINKEKAKKYPIYEKLIRLSGIYITTNIDDCFDEFFIPEKVYHATTQFNDKNFKKNSLFHLHGSIKGNGTILTTRDYVEHYNNKTVQDFLRLVFQQDYLILFLGYNLNELEILDYLNLKGGNIGCKEDKHIILLPFYKVEKELLRHEREYFSDFGIEVIPYAIDKCGYEQLYDILSIWEKEINGTTPLLYTSYDYIEKSIKTYDKENVLEVLQMIKNNASFRAHFFEHLDNPLWFDVLEERGYFDPKQMPGPQPGKDEGYYVIPEWEVLRYLEKVAQKVNEPANDVYIEKLLKTIRNVSTYCRSNGVENYRSWWYFAKILSFIPVVKIPIDVIELIPFWLESRFDTMLQGEAIADKLLNKVLLEAHGEEKQKAEKIFSYILNFRELPPREAKAAFGRKKEFSLNIEPHWLEESLEKNGPLIAEQCSIMLVKDIAMKIKQVLKKSECWTIVGSKNSYSLKCKIEEGNKLKIVVEKIVGRSPDVVRNETNPQWTLVGEKELNIISERIRSEEVFELIVKSFEDDGKFSEIFNDVAREKLIYGIHGMLLNLFRDGTYESFSRKREMHSRYDVLDMLTSALKDILIIKAEKDSGMTKEIVDMFLEDDYLYFIKMAVFIIGKYPKHAKIYLEHLKHDKYNVLLDGYSMGSELKQLLEGLTELSPEELEMLDKKIEMGQILYIFEEKYQNVWRQERYKALSHYEVFKRKYEELKALTGYDASLHAAFGEVEAGFVKELSPVKPEDIISKSNYEIVQLLAGYQPPKRQKMFERESIRGLGEVFGLAIQQQPNRFIDGLMDFINVGYFYIYEMLEGLKAVWEKRTGFNAIKVFDFVIQYINRQEFWDDKYVVKNDEWRLDHRGVVGALGEFIQAGTRDDNWAFGEDVLGKVKDALFLCLEKIEPSEKVTNDPMTAVLNTYQGKIIRALIELILRLARIEEGKGVKRESKWDDDARNAFERTLEAGIIDAYTLLGHYLPQLSYIDKIWVNKRIKELEGMGDAKLWEAFMAGYLFNSTVYKDLFVAMQGHYNKALGYKFSNSHANESLIQHIAVGYTREQKDGELLYNQILQQWDYEQIGELISFYWMQRDFLSAQSDETGISQIKQRIVDEVKRFWRKVYERYEVKEKDKLSEDDKRILSQILKMIILLPEIDEEGSRWILQAISYVEVDYNSAFVLEYLYVLKDKGNNPQLSAELIGTIYIKMLDNTLPSYNEEHIKSIVRFIYKYCKTLADTICIKYSSRGSDMLRDIWIEHNQDVEQDHG
jgi:hypothetical protein